MQMERMGKIDRSLLNAREAAFGRLMGRLEEAMAQL